MPPLLPPILRLRRVLRLPLHVARIVSPASLERHDVVNDVVATPGGVAVDVDAAGRAMACPRRTHQEEDDGEQGSCRVEPSHVPSGLLVGYKASLRPSLLTTATPRRASREKAVSLPAYGFGAGPTPCGWAESSTYFP